MNHDINKLMNELEEQMMKSLEHLENEFSSIRTGKASPALVENISVNYYGSATKMKVLAGITTPEPRLLVIQPWDPSSVPAIEKAIISSELGISPVSDGKVIRLPIPELSEERRQKLAKQAHTISEDAKIAIRNIRREGNDIVKKAEKNSDITEDDRNDMLDDIQQLTDKYIDKIDENLKEKEDELLSI